MTESKTVTRKNFAVRPCVLNSHDQINFPKLKGLLITIVRSVIKKFDLPFYSPNELQGWGHCGCCGKSIFNEVFPKYWAWGLCVECQGDHPIKEDGE